MCWKRKKSKKQLMHEETLKAIEDLKSLLVNDEIRKLQNSKIRLEQIQNDLKSVRFSVERINKGYDDNGDFYIKVAYKIDPVILTFNGKEMNFNQKFKSINELDLISYEDMGKIKKFMDRVKKEL